MQLHGWPSSKVADMDQSTVNASINASVQFPKNDKLNHTSPAPHPQHPKDNAVVSLAPTNELIKECTVELARHVQTVHGGESAKRFACHALGCFDGHLPWSFARSDKLTSHVKATHNYSTIFNRCPVATCSFEPCTLEVLGVHIQHVHHALEEGRAVLNATPCKTRKCPLWQCGKYFVANQLMAHIQSHASDDLEVAKSALETEGFLLEATTQIGSLVHVVCPVCHAVAADTIQFMRHLATEHLQTSTSGGYLHFEKWKAYWNQNIPKNYAANIKKLLPWSRIGGFESLRRSLDYQCPCCPFSVAGVGGGFGAQETQDQQDKRALILGHHLSLLRPEAEVVAELYPHRMAILRLWPEFVTHPVFADFDQVQQQNTSALPETQESYMGQHQDDFGIPQWSAGDFNASA
jgi:hypothetical protein